MTVAPAPPPSRPLAGALWMLGSGLSFVCVNGIVKYLGPGVPPAEAAFVRYAFGLVLLIPMLPALRAARIGARGHALFALRGLVQAGGVICWFFAMARIPLAEVTAMGYLTPVGVTIGAALVLGEQFALRRALAIVAALVGMLIVLRPGFRELSAGHLAQLTTSVLFAASYLIAKRMTDWAPPAVIVAMMSIWVTVCLAPVAAAVWTPLSAGAAGGLFLVAAFATSGHWCMVKGFQAAPLTVTQPVTFLQLIWATLLGALAFGEPLDPFVILGGAIIMAAVSFITWREAVIRRRMITPPPEALKG
ncbi:MAG: DMT family transporter [Rhodobacteraceae bacterium]|nr:DMT family transporter [Paracoccaceae bacterium]